VALVEYSATGGQRRDRRFFIAVHQSAVALDIRGEDCSETSLERRSLHSGLTFEIADFHQAMDPVAVIRPVLIRLSPN
jgi:hypothetical protein